MDRNTVIGLLLIFVITIAWAWFTMPSQEELEQRRVEQALQDSLAAMQTDQQVDTISVAPDSQANQSPSSGTETQEIAGNGGQVESTPQNMGVFGEATYADTVLTTIRTDKFEILMSNVGAGPLKITLHDYQTWDDRPVQMIRDTTHSVYSLGFISNQNYNIETNRLVFEPLNNAGTIELAKGDSAEVSYRLKVGDDSALIFTYTFFGNKYSYNLDVQLENLQPYISGTNVDFGWTAALNLTEHDQIKDAQNSGAYVFAGGELEKFLLDKDSEQDEQRINGTIEWVSTRSRFFGQYIKPLSNSNAAILRGEDLPGNDIELYNRYQAAIQSSYVQDQELSYQLYAGPIRYYDLKNFDEHAYDVLQIGYAIFRWFADPLVRHVIIPFFAYGSLIIPNYGILIILFGVIVKIVLFPLTQKSFKSMAAMKELQPQMKEIQEKYKDDPQKQQKETLALYKKKKVNPLGGCLPMLLQFPILVTLFYFFRNSMTIRQKSFLWAHDLSAPDYIIHLPFNLPVLGHEIAGFVLLMVVAMFFQTKVSGSGGAAPSGGPNMKGFTYVMPFIMLIVFNKFAAGLSLYYLVYNVISVAQQAIINKKVGKAAPEAQVVSTGSNKGKRKR